MAGVKLDKDKPLLSLLPWKAVSEIAKVLSYGAQKYSANNWRKGFTYSRVSSALYRHMVAWEDGEDNDPETGLSHLAHAGCNVLFLLHFILTGTGTDDRPHKENQ